MKKTLATLCLFALPVETVWAQERMLLTYSTLGTPDIVDFAPEGLSVGDMYTRRGIKLSAPDGLIVGDYFSQATIVHIAAKTNTSVRSYFIELITEDGSIFMMDLIEVNHAEPSLKLTGHEGAVIGGTGAYSGIRGSYSMDIVDGTASKTIFYNLPGD